ncbi:MAG: CvpA family protein, partial [Nitratireductor sp.]
MPITLLDGILIGFTLVSAVLAMVRGFSREILSIASWAAAAAAAYFFHPLVQPYVTPYIDNAQIALAAAAAIVFFVALIVVSVITMKVADFIINSRVGALDRTLGFVYGAARGVLVIAVALLF